MRLSEEKRKKIAEQIIGLLYLQNTQPLFTSQIANDLVRDEEFIKTLLLELEQKQLIIRVEKNASGETYTRRVRWRIAPKVYNLYKQKQQS